MNLIANFAVMASRRTVFDVPVCDLGWDDALVFINELLSMPVGQTSISFVNAHNMLLALRDEEYRDILSQNLVLPDGMSDWNRSMERDGMASADQVASANIHAYVGVSILALVVLRLILRFTRGVPASPPQEPPIFRMAATAAHAALYILLVAMPLTGMAAYYLGYGSAGELHADVLKVALWVLISGHVLGALVHQFYWKTNVLRRMTTGQEAAPADTGDAGPGSRPRIDSPRQSNGRSREDDGCVKKAGPSSVM
jgi:cytochrome b561